MKIKIFSFLQNKKCFSLILVFGLFFGFWCGALSNSAFATTHTLNVSTSGARNIDVLIKENGNGTTISADNITVATTCKNGYNFTISTSVNDNNLYLGGDSSNNTSGTYFAPSNGSTILSEAFNTWGYYYNSNSAVAPTSSSVFNAIPVIGSAATIKSELTTPSVDDISDSFSIYYGVSVANNMAPGVYKMIPDSNNSNNDGTIIYNVTMADACINYAVHFNPTSTADGSSLSGTGTMDDQTVTEGIATPLNNNTYIAPIGYRFKEWNTAQDGTGTAYTDGQNITDLIAAGDTITLYAQWEGDDYEIIYDKNNTNATGAGAYGYTFQYKGGFSWDASTTAMPLRAPNYQLDGYGFAGWSVDPDVANDINSANHEYIYGAEEIFTTSDYYLVSNADQNNVITLYAVWVPSAGNLQNWSGCSSLNQGEVTALTDTRDNNTYAVAKLVDDKCWVIENSRLNPGTATINALNTNNPTSDFAANISGTSSTAQWCTSTTVSCIERIAFNTDNLDGLSVKTNYGEVRYGYGVYYNWYTATAGHGVDDVSPSGAGGTVAGDLCPAGWHLPSGDSWSSDFGTFAGIMWNNNNEDFFKFPNNFVKSGGIFDNAVPQNRDSMMHLQSNTENSTWVKNVADMYAGINGGTVTWIEVQDGHQKQRGVPFRCINY